MVWRLSGSCCRWSLPAKSSQLSACCHWSRAQSRSCTARLSQKTTWCQRARSRSWMAQVECWSACVSQYRPPKAVLVAISAEGVSTSWPKAAQACLTSCSGTHSVERVERSGKEEREAHAEVSCCACADRGNTVVIGSPFLCVEENICSTCDRSARPVKMKSAELVSEKGQTVRECLS